MTITGDVKALLASVRDAHEGDGISCRYCAEDWPCEAVRLADALEAAHARNADLERIADRLATLVEVLAEEAGR
jgi:hypothetical protein